MQTFTPLSGKWWPMLPNSKAVSALRSWYHKRVSSYARAWFRELRSPANWPFHLQTAFLKYALRRVDYSARGVSGVLGHSIPVMQAGLIECLIARRQLRPIIPMLSTALDQQSLRNVLPNSGPIPVSGTFASAKDIVDTYTDPSRRSQGTTDYPGFALDDAVYDAATEGWEMWSNARLASWLALYACGRYANPTLLELGCGAAHLFTFFRYFNLLNYVGIDGNPYIVKFNRILEESRQYFHILNLQERIQLAAEAGAQKFDLVLSFEVLEHIREGALDDFLWTVREHLHSQSRFIATASTIDNYDVHVLVRTRLWWLERFAASGLIPAADSDKLCRAILDRHPFNWDSGTTEVFV